MERNGLPELDGAELLETLRALPEGVARIGRDGQVRFLNPAGQDVLGVGPDEWAGRNLQELLEIHGGVGRTHPLDVAVVFDHLGTGRTWSREDAWIVRRADEREIPAAYAFAPVFRGGRLDGAVLAFRDLTERRRTERAIHEARLGLAAAGEVEAAKTAFLSAVSRDVLAPVDVLVGAAERLVAGELPEELREEAETVRASARAVVSVLADLLDWARIEAGALALQPIEFDLRTALGEVLDAQRPAASEKGLTLELRVEDGGVNRVVADPGRVRQVTGKLVSHAIRWTPQGRIVVTPETTFRSRAEAMVRVRVDHGGPTAVETIDGRDLAPVAGVRPTGARGGVALASRLVERMDGALGGETRPDGTATSWFELRVPLGPSRSRDLRAADLRGVRALVIDSSEAGRELLAKKLAGAGLRCTTTGSGGQALRLLRSALEEWDPYRIAILSAPLREMDAATLGDLVKGDPRLRDTALVYLASVGEPGDARKLESIGFAAYLVKPVSDDVLRAALSVVWGTALLRAEPQLVTRHALRDSRIVRLTPDEIRDRVARPVRDEAATAVPVLRASPGDDV